MMHSLRTFLCLLSSVLWFAGAASAATYCVGPTATGNGSGSDWNNQLAWSTSFTRGNTYYVADGNYASKTLSTATSGTTLITVKKATASDHGTETGWVSTLGDGQAVITAPLVISSNYWVFSGQQRSGLRSGYGFRVDGNSFKSAASQVQLGVSNSTAVSNVTVSYVEVQGSGEAGGAGGSQDTYNDDNITLFSTSGFSGCQNITLDHCWFYDSGRVPVFTLQAKGLLVEYCVIEKNDSTDNNHSEGMVLRGKPNGTGTAADCGNYVIRYNVFSDIEGSAFIGTPSGPTHWWTNLSVYGNIFMRPQTPTRGGCSGGPLAMWDVKAYGDIIFANNTMINLRTGGYSASPISANNSNVYPRLTFWYYASNDFGDVQNINNLYVNCDNVSTTFQDGTSTTDSYTQSHNAYFSTTVNAPQDTNGQTLGSDPLPSWESGDFELALATTAGTSLASPYNVDPNGDTRGGDGTWDRGAYEFGSGGPDTTPPTVSSAAINTAGTALTITLNEATTRSSTNPTVSLSGGAATATYASGSGTTALVFTLSRTVAGDESGTVSATLGSNAWEDAAGNDVATFGPVAITNASTYPFPTVVSVTETVSSTNSTTHNVLMPPTVAANQGLIVIGVSDGNPTWTTPSGWTLLSAGTPSGTAVNVAAWKKLATGSEDGTSVDFATSTSERCAFQVYLVDDWADDITAITAGTAATGTSTAPNPPSVSAAAAGNSNLYIAVEGHDDTGATSGYPSSYGSAVSSASSGTGSVVLTTARRLLASDSDDPGVFAISSQEWVAQTIVVTTEAGEAGDVVAPTIEAITIAAGGTTVSYATSETVTTGAGGNGTATLSLSGGAVTVTITSVSGTTIAGSLSRTIGAGETGTGGYTQPGNGVEDTSGNDLATVASIAVTNNSGDDQTAPTPNPATWSQVPTAVSSTAVQMIASQATDAATGPVFYDFDETTAGSGANDSGQQAGATYVDEGLTAGTQYTYRHRTFDSASPQNSTSFSSSLNVTTLALPGTPGSPAATGVSDTQINVTWNDTATGETGYFIWRSTTEGFTPAGSNRVAELGPNVTSWADTGLTAGVTYYYRIRAYRDAAIVGPPEDYSAFTSEFSGTAAAIPDPTGPVVRNPRRGSRWFPWNWWR